MREQNKQSVAEVSGAVEIDERVLERIESGHERPAEEVLMLLISYFDMHEHEAVRLWELAGYEAGAGGPKSRNEEALQDVLSGVAKSVVMVVQADARTHYVDVSNVQANRSGIVMQFGQQAAKGEQTVAKVGMSLAQAEATLAQLQSAVLKARYQSSPKALPPTTKA